MDPRLEEWFATHPQYAQPTVVDPNAPAPTTAPGTAPAPAGDQSVGAPDPGTGAPSQQQQPPGQLPDATAAGAQVAPNQPTVVDPYALPASPPTLSPGSSGETVTLADGTQVTPQALQELSLVHQWITGMSAEQMARLQAYINNPNGVPSQPNGVPAPTNGYTVPPNDYVQPQNPYIPQPNTTIQPGQQFFGPPGSVQGVTQPPSVSGPLPAQMFADPFAAPQPVIQTPVVQQPTGPDPYTAQQLATLAAQQQQLAQQQAAYQAQIAAQNQAATLKPYGDAAINQFKSTYQLPDADMAVLIQKTQQANDLLQRTFAASPADPTAAYYSAFEQVAFADPALRQRIVDQQASRQLAADRATQQARARAGSLAGSAGSVPRADTPLPTSPSGQPDYRAGMVAELRGVLSGNGSSPN
jgi:hypothetical protein